MPRSQSTDRLAGDDTAGVARIAPDGVAGWLLVLAGATSSSWPVAEPVWVAIPVAVVGAALVARSASASKP